MDAKVIKCLCLQLLQTNVITVFLGHKEVPQQTFYCLELKLRGFLSLKKILSKNNGKPTDFNFHLA